MQPSKQDEKNSCKQESAGCTGYPRSSEVAPFLQSEWLQSGADFAICLPMLFSKILRGAPDAAVLTSDVARMRRLRSQ